MNHDDWPRRLNPPRRNHFFFGKMMGVAQFEREQRYGMGQRWLMNRLSLGTGILCGLEARPLDGKRIHLKPGVAVDPLGREIIVARPFDFDPFQAPAACGSGESPAPTEAGSYYLCLSYHECAADALPVPQSDDCAGVPDCEADTTVETFSLALIPVPDTTDPSPFDCDGWMAPRENGDDGGDGDEDDEDEEATPPGLADLQGRLAAMLKTTCPPVPAEACVVLGTVLIEGSPGDFIIQQVSLEGRVYLYSQAQLLDMMLCLAQRVAKCCAGEPPEIPTVSEDTLRLTSVEFLRPSDVQLLLAPPILVATLTSLTPPPSIPWAGTGGGGIETTGPSTAQLYLRFTFNKPVDGTSVSSTFGGTPGIGITRSVTDLTGTTTEPVEVFTVLTNADVVETVVPGFVGEYEVVLSGTSSGSQAAIRSWDKVAAKRRLFDGEPKSATTPLPSGNGQDGGDFKFTFNIEPPPTP